MLLCPLPSPRNDQGVLSSGIAYYVQGLVMNIRGPVFATAFNPLCMIIVVALGYLIFGEQLYLGRPAHWLCFVQLLWLLGANSLTLRKSRTPSPVALLQSTSDTCMVLSRECKTSSQQNGAQPCLPREYKQESMFHTVGLILLFVFVIYNKLEDEFRVV